LKYIRLGDPFPEEGLARYKGFHARDTLFFEGEYSWRAIVLEYPEGSVYLEEDFFGGQTLNRIRVETPALHFRKTIRVGDPVERLTELRAKWSLTWIPDYNRIDIYSPLFPHIRFLALPEMKDGASETEPDLDIRMLRPEARIISIVIM
jgi:hypothetical protein